MFHIVETGHDGLGDPYLLRHRVVVSQCRAWDGQLDYDLFCAAEVTGEGVHVEDAYSGLLIQDHRTVWEPVGLGYRGVAQFS